MRAALPLVLPIAVVATLMLGPGCAASAGGKGEVTVKSPQQRERTRERARSRIEPRVGAVQKGKGVWYGDRWHGRKTASGERFDQWAMTAAHKTLPLGTIVEVTNLRNGRSLRLRINDRGPYGKGRIIDVSKGAARKLRMVRAGVVPVTVEVIRLPPRKKPRS